MLALGRALEIGDLFIAHLLKTRHHILKREVFRLHRLRALPHRRGRTALMPATRPLLPLRGTLLLRLHGALDRKADAPIVAHA